MANRIVEGEPNIFPNPLGLAIAALRRRRRSPRQPADEVDTTPDAPSPEAEPKAPES